ncbi:hypothetical protein M0804_010172 [Polistes exclamans]|nr:hypothetical protein M0804_010172 [Polistes exclamans]
MNGDGLSNSRRGVLDSSFDAASSNVPAGRSVIHVWTYGVNLRRREDEVQQQQQHQPRTLNGADGSFHVILVVKLSHELKEPPLPLPPLPPPSSPALPSKTTTPPPPPPPSYSIVIIIQAPACVLLGKYEIRASDNKDTAKEILEKPRISSSIDTFSTTFYPHHFTSTIFGSRTIDLEEVSQSNRMKPKIEVGRGGGGGGGGGGEEYQKRITSSKVKLNFRQFWQENHENVTFSFITADT